jgi:outer membrane protein
MVAMRGLASVMVVASALASTHAFAQHENHSLSLAAGYTNLRDAAAATYGFPIGFGCTGYIDSGFEWTANVDAMLLTESGTARNIFGLAAGPGLRYLFLQESIRPWVGAEISYLHLFQIDQASSHLGLGPNAGLDFFVTEQFSLGLKGHLDFYAILRDPIALRTSVGGVLVGSAWF